MHAAGPPDPEPVRDHRVVLGDRAERGGVPWVAREVAAAGHKLVSRTWHHCNLRYMHAVAGRDEISRAAGAIHAAAGNAPARSGRPTGAAGGRLQPVRGDRADSAGLAGRPARRAARNYQEDHAMTDDLQARPATHRERDALLRVARMNARLAKDGVAQREAQLLAKADEDLAAAYRFDDDAWAEITRAAEAALYRADQRIAQACRDLGIQERFRPQLTISWSGRGENAMAERRAELRRVARAKIKAAGQEARLAIDRQAAKVMTELIAGGLKSAEAKALLESIPAADKLMPPVAVAELETASDAASGRGHGYPAAEVH